MEGLQRIGHEWTHVCVCARAHTHTHTHRASREWTVTWPRSLEIQSSSLCPGQRKVTGERCCKNWGCSADILGLILYVLRRGYSQEAIPGAAGTGGWYGAPHLGTAQGIREWVCGAKGKSQHWNPDPFEIPLRRIRQTHSLMIRRQMSGFWQFSWQRAMKDKRPAESIWFAICSVFCLLVPRTVPGAFLALTEYLLNKWMKGWRQGRKWKCQSLPCLTLCDPMDCSPSGSSVHEILQARILEWEWRRIHSLLQGIFPIQGSNSSFLHCRQILYHLSLQGRPWEERRDN